MPLHIDRFKLLCRKVEVPTHTGNICSLTHLHRHKITPITCFFLTDLPQCSCEGQKIGAIKKERIRGWEGCLEPNRVGFQEKSHLSCQSLSFLLEKLIPVPLPADMIPRLQETTQMNRSRWTVWGFYHWRSDWIPQYRDEPFFHGPAELSFPKQVQWSEIYLSLYLCNVCQGEMWAWAHLCVCLLLVGLQITSLFKHTFWVSAMVSRL